MCVGMFPNDFPQLLLKRAVSLTEWGISNYAWRKEDAIKTILFQNLFNP